MPTMTRLAMALSMAWGILPAYSADQPTPSEDETVLLKEVTVTATRTARKVDNVPNTVSVITKAQIDEKGAQNVKDMLEDELDVSVRSAPTRFTAAGASTGRAGNESVNIRGLEGNQVLMMVDGVRLPNSFSFGSMATSRADFIDIEGLKAVEVLRGPTSTQFGSDGLAGAVSFRTLDPSDVLKKDQTLGGYIKTSYASIDQSLSTTAAVAGQNEDWQGLLVTNYRKGHETENMGSDNSQNSNRTAANPVDYDSQYVLGKLKYRVNAANQLGIAFEDLKRDQETEVYSARAVTASASTSVIDTDATDHTKRQRVSIEHQFSDVNAPWFQKAETKLYWQKAEVNQFTTEDRYTAADRTRDNHYKQDVVGISSLFESNLSGAVNQRLTYGFDWSQSNLSSLRDGTVAPAGETFPSKPFPDTKYTLAGAFIQDEIELGKLSIIPGLRFDSYQLTPSSAGYTGTIVNLSDQAVTPRLGLIWKLDPAFSPYLQVAKGFKAPTPDQVNTSFSNPTYGYTSVGNANLKAERVNSIELGLRGKTDQFRYSVSAFDNRYKDFISQQVVSGSGTSADPSVYQYINLANAHIRGLEARTEWNLTDRWSMNAGFAYAKGDSTSGSTTTPLDSINPLKVVWGIGYDAGTYGGKATITHSKAKKANEVGSVNGSAQFTTPAYTIMDLSFYWKPSKQLTFNANLNNVFNKKYWRWSDARGLTANSSVIDAYTAAGRNFVVTMKYDF